MAEPTILPDAIAQAALVHDGEATPRELVETAIAAAEAVNSELNAIIHERFDRALDEADSVDASLPLAGVPIVIKDLDGSLAGEPHFMGTRHLRDADYHATVTSTLFERLTAAGCVIIGATNTPEFGLVPTTEPLSFGPARNPWDTTRSTGGSSGGSAAAVSSGIVAIGHAGDGGGSIRIPASECGLVGLKPSRGRVPLGPIEMAPWGGLVQRLAVTRTVRDTAAVLDAVAGPAPADPYGIAAPGRRYAEDVASPVGPLRLAVATHASAAGVVHPEIVDAVVAVGEQLEKAGHQIVSGGPPQLDEPGFTDRISGAFLTMYPVWVAQSVDDIAAKTGTAVGDEGLEPATARLAEGGRLVDALSFLNASDELMRAGGELAAWWESGSVDVLLLPTLPDLPPPLGYFAATEDDPMAGVMRSSAFVAFTMPFNVSGQPAISLPLGVSSEGLPIGVQLVAARGREDLLLGLAAQLETLMPWAARRPAVSAASAR